MSTPSLFYREIPLTQGKVALVDLEDYEWLMQWRWFAHHPGTHKGFYAKRKLHRHERSSDKRIEMPMHRQILGLKHGDPQEVDHINCNSLDNRRFNLRITDMTGNSRNKRLRRDNKSGYKGVCFKKETRKWVARIGYQGKKIHLGYFSDPRDAYAAYCAAISKYHGEFARMDSRQMTIEERYGSIEVK